MSEANGTMHAAKVEKSYRLTRVLMAIKKRRILGISSWDLMQEAQTVAPGTCVSELRKAGHIIHCKSETNPLTGTRIYRYTYGGKKGSNG